VQRVFCLLPLARGGFFRSFESWPAGESKALFFRSNSTFLRSPLLGLRPSAALDPGTVGSAGCLK